MKKLSFILALAFLLASSAFAEKSCEGKKIKLSDGQFHNVGCGKKVSFTKEECSKIEYNENGLNGIGCDVCYSKGFASKSCKESIVKDSVSRAYWDNRVKEVGQERASKEWNEQRKSKKPKK